MSATILDIIEGGRVKETRAGIETDRIALVTGLTGDGDARLYSALSAPGLPIIGEEHPSIPEIYVDERNVQPAHASDNADARVVLTYRAEGQVVDEGSQTTPTEIVEVGTTLEQGTTAVDIFGEPISVEWLPTGDVQNPEVPKLYPRTTMHFHRREDTSPEAKSKLYVGKVNTGDHAWDRDPDALEAQWMCMAILGRSTDNGLTYEVDYDFEFAEEDWQGAAYYRDPNTGRRPEIKAYGGYTKEQVLAAAIVKSSIYESIDFNDLNL